MRKFLPWIFISSFVLGIFTAAYTDSAKAAPASHIVISQVQARGVGIGNANNEFVELYNPTNSAVNLSGWSLKHETMNGATTSANLVTSIAGTIQPNGYFLIGSPEYAASISADIAYSNGNHITSDNTVLLFSDSGSTLIDKVGMGSAVDFETSSTVNPPDGGSVQRKVDETGGHGLDTNNNSNDFEALSVSIPRNSSVIITPTPTSQPTATPTPTLAPTATPTPEPTATPTPTIEPTDTPIPTPTVTPTPQPTTTPTPAPTNTPTPTVTPTPTLASTPAPTLVASPTPTMTITPTATATPTLTPPLIPTFRLVCTTQFIDLHVLNLFFHIPYPVCNLVKI